MPIMTATYTNAASGDLNSLNLTLISAKYRQKRQLWRGLVTA